MQSPARWFENLPPQAAVPASVLATLCAVAGCGLILTGVIHGAWGPVVWALPLFALAGVLWHAADHAAGR